jgi:hypothetical protein
MNHAAAETALVDQLEIHPDTVGEGPFASSNHDRWTNRWYSSTNPALIACAASSGPPTVIYLR